MRYETFECDICHAKNNHLHNGDENNIMLQAYVDDHSGHGGNWEDDGNYECCRECYKYIKDVIRKRISANQ